MPTQNTTNQPAASIAITDTDTKPTTPALPKTATITLTAPSGATMAIVAERKADGAAKTYMLTSDENGKNARRGMTEQHATFEAAKVAIEKMAAKAEKLNWKRRAARRGFVAKPDAFTEIPPAPKAKK